MSQERVVVRESTGPGVVSVRERMRTVASGEARRRLLKSRDGIPPPRPRPSGVDVAHEARIARRRFYPVTFVYTAYALAVFALGLRESAATALSWAAAGVCSWPLIEYSFHRHVLHGCFADGEGWVRRALHVWLDSLHAEHHERPWDGRHVNGGLATVPVAAVLVLTGLLAPLPTWPVFVAAVLQCYVVEEWIHYAVHFHRFRIRYFDFIRRHHLFHHGARGRDVAFGLTSSLWDVPFKTAAPHAVRRRADKPNAPGRKRGEGDDRVAHSVQRRGAGAIEWRH